MRPFMIAIAVLAMLAPSAWFFWQARDAPHLGTFEDDSLYLVAGQSLAEGKGYRILSLPGEPYQTKYPPLYPLILAAVWKIDGNFPANMPKVMLAQWLLWLLFLATAALMLWSLKPLDASAKWAALVFIAVSPPFVYLGLSIMPETLFASLCLLTIYLADFSDWPVNLRALLAGACAAGAVMTKIAALPLIAAVFIAMLIKKRFLGAFLFAALPGLAVAGWAAWAASHRLETQDLNFIYYVDYIKYYVNTVSLSDLQRIIMVNLSSFAETVGQTVFFFLNRASMLLLFHIVSGFIVVVITVVFLLKINLNSLVLFSLFYSIQLFFWNYMPDARFVFPLLVFFTTGIFWGINQVSKRFLPGPRRIRAFLVSATIIIAWALLQTYFYLNSFIPVSRLIWARLSCASSWIKDSVPGESTFLTYRDVDLFLLSGRRGLRPVRRPTLYYHNDVTAIERPLRSISKYAATAGIDYLLWDRHDFSGDPYLGDAGRKEKILSEIKGIVLEREICGVRIFRFTGV